MQLKLKLLLAPICLLGACALEPKRIEPPSTRVVIQPAAASETDQLLAYLMRARAFQTPEFTIEREQLRYALQKQKTDFMRVKLALLLSSAAPIPAPSGATSIGNDEAEVIALLEPIVAGAPASDGIYLAEHARIRALATLLHGMANDRRKLREQWRETQARLSALRRDDTKGVEARALRARVEELEQKLAALKSIDRSVNRRAEMPRTEAPRAEPAK